METKPVPLSLTVCGPESGSPEMLSVPVLVPAATGVKVTEMVQSAPALKVVGQVLVWEKSPLAVMLEIVTATLLVLVRVTVWARLPIPTL